ncbi:hypothetical protein AB0C52_24390 [Streptomyces sp. NPDC048717]|uniref:hypothetical protein n=1 Tax=Streptomyces sp. NPDC048717 TaxID=3154928 RepID=UPI00341F2018
MRLLGRAGPGVEEQVGQVAGAAACKLADAAAGSGWSTAAVDDALVAITPWPPRSPRGSPECWPQ